MGAGLDLNGAVSARCLDELANGPASSCFDPPADRQGREHDREVGLGGVPGPVVDRAGLQVAFGHPERALDLVELVVGADHELRGDRCAVRAGAEVSDVSLQPSQRPGLGLELAVDGPGAPVRRMNRLRFTGTFPATACSALRTCSSIPRSVRRARSCRYW